MLSKYYFFHNTDMNPYQTLALEEAILNIIAPDEIMLYLYAHADTVVIGKNQNAWAECRHEQFLKDGGKLARRISGGGAVFHDTGNINFSFIVGRENYDLSRQLKVILNAVRSFGIDAEFSGRNDIVTNGKKFSGNAFCFRKTGAFHHGTVLIKSSVDKIAKYLAVPKDKIASKGISSVRSRVINLSEINDSMTPELMAQALKQSFSEEYGQTSNFPKINQAFADAKAFAERNASWNWQFGESPAFDITLSTRFPWGGIEFQLKLKDAIIEQAKVFSDSLEPDLIADIPAQLTGCSFRSENMAVAILGVPHANTGQKMLLEDIAAYIIKQNY